MCARVASAVVSVVLLRVSRKVEKKCIAKETSVSESAQSHVGERGPPVLIRLLLLWCRAALFVCKAPPHYDLEAPIALSTACNSRRRSTLPV